MAAAASSDTHLLPAVAAAATNRSLAYYALSPPGEVG